MSKYTQLTQEQRYQICALNNADHKQLKIVEIVGVHKSTINRELVPNHGLQGYHPIQEHQLATIRRKSKVCFHLSPTDCNQVEQIRLEQWGQEKIRLWQNEQNHLSKSYEWIYQHILKGKRDGGMLNLELSCQKQRNKHDGSYKRRGRVPNKVSVEQLPAIVVQRAHLGVCKLVTIIGKSHKQSIVSLTERKSHLSFIGKVASKGARGAKRLFAHCSNSCQSMYTLSLQIMGRSL